MCMGTTEKNEKGLACRAWTLMSEPSDVWGPVPNPLPSDSRLRKDLRALAEGDLVKAQVRSPPVFPCFPVEPTTHLLAILEYVVLL